MALTKLGNQSAKASALLVMAGIGGAFWPMLQAVVADNINLLSSFTMKMQLYQAM